MSEPTLLPSCRLSRIPHRRDAPAGTEFYAEMRRRRTVRQFTPATGGPARGIHRRLPAGRRIGPSGANLQPWKFVVVTDPQIKREIHQAAEKEQHEFYTRRASEEWLKAMSSLGIDEHVPYLETAPFLIVIFEQIYGVAPDGRKVKNYYSIKSVGIATGLLVAAVHRAGLVSLTHTPSPMEFLNVILRRPPNERPFLILVVGYPAEDAVVPAIPKKSLEEICTFVKGWVRFWLLLFLSPVRASSGR